MKGPRLCRGECGVDVGNLPGAEIDQLCGSCAIFVMKYAAARRHLPDARDDGEKFWQGVGVPTTEGLNGFRHSNWLVLIDEWLAAGRPWGIGPIQTQE